MKFSAILWLLFLWQSLQLQLSLSLDRGNETDRLSLLAFKAQISGDPLGILSSWNESNHFCKWLGVICGSKRQRVVELDLHDSQLVGILAPHIGNLTFLKSVKLYNNSLSHRIPPELGYLFRLQRLNLSENMFVGDIPINISNCSSLVVFDVGYNNLTGKIPAEFGSLTKLQTLRLVTNNIAGTIPPSLGNLSYLESLYGTRNNLHGAIPYSIGRLERLKYLYFCSNNLTGTIPPSIFNLSSLRHLSLPLNQLHGNLPTDLGNTLPHLENLNIYDNLFSGIIPPTISNASSLFRLSVGKNKFTGKVPSLAKQPKLQMLLVDGNSLGNREEDDLGFINSLANCTDLKTLGISGNNFGGMMPATISNFTKLEYMGFGGNEIRGRIPPDIGNLIHLTTLSLGTNHLTGTIPSSIGKLQNLGDMNLQGNELSGSIPSTMGNMTTLSAINLSMNNLQGSIPSSLGDCQKVLSMDLSRNNLSGSIPKEVFQISSLTKHLVLSDNELAGSLPTEVGQLVMLGALYVSNNQLSGEIPESLGTCRSLEYMSLAGNFLEGTIPKSLSSLRAIQGLDLSHNHLSGQIPEYLAELKLLESLDLSFNDFEGEVPLKGVFANQSQVQVMGNSKLCGGTPQLNLSRCSSSELTKKCKFIVATICPLLGLISTTLLLTFLCFRARKTIKAQGCNFISSFWQVRFEDLSKATDGFSSANSIGAGGFGSVYYGILERNEAPIAVKVFNLLTKGASKSFMAECEALKNVRHRNLVKILTACSSVDFQGNDFKALVYEYMVNGSLESWLHPTDEPEEVQGPRTLNLLQRLSIAIDVASALDYLHHDCEPPIVHCDLKPSNVLLDGDLAARVGDFGLARFLLNTSNQLSSEQSISLGIKGTIGYAPPEYGMGSEVTTYGDTYSYGILLLEMFTGKRPTDNMFRDGLNLHNFSKSALTRHVLEILDPSLLAENEETSRIEAHSGMAHPVTPESLEALMSVVKIGVACSEEVPRKRMGMGTVVVELRRIRGILSRTWTRIVMS
ncbi:hypothetical protein K2173_002178 [Erythroxylum novogranatense]|uniref:non-specific serine/threonine protein kinase n=1 Tax=Erythroxylum novogranatense TaxID=1862640 RepID=A0AAV8SQM6_9ROSI|nr:hypothetical protein K2173_002178 [Erythroxylum novogranatense]